MEQKKRPDVPRTVLKHEMLRREAARVRENVSAMIQKSETAGGQTDRPEANAAEQMKTEFSGSIQTAVNVGMQSAKRGYLRGAMLREKARQGRAAAQHKPDVDNESAQPALPDIPGIEMPENTLSSNSKTDTRRETIRRQLYAKRAITKQAEKEAVRRGTESAAQAASPLASKRAETRRQIFVQHAASQKLMDRPSVNARPLRFAASRPISSRPRSFSARRGRLGDGIRRTASKLAATLAHTVRAAVGSLAALIGAGGVVLLLVMVMGAAAAIIGSPMGILFSDDAGGPNAISIAGIVQEVNADFGQTINDIVAAHPECDEVDIQYHYGVGCTWASYWPEVLAVFAVRANLGDDGNVVVIDQANAQKIRDTFWAMHTITAEVEAVEIEPEPEEPEETAETDGDTDSEETAATPQYRYILHISVSGKTADEMADSYRFSAGQRDILHQLLSPEMRPALLALCGGSTLGGGAVGTLLWPLPGITNITCRFGEPDAIRGLPHKGVDIAAPEGTSILAAHDGTVLISGWNDSYGNQVVLDNGAGLSTRYAHMVGTAVSAGETVTAGQVIGYVGSTGDSTGNHLHFEVMMNGMRCDPLVVCQP